YVLADFGVKLGGPATFVGVHFSHLWPPLGASAFIVLEPNQTVTTVVDVTKLYRLPDSAGSCTVTATGKFRALPPIQIQFPTTRGELEDIPFHSEPLN